MNKFLIAAVLAIASGSAVAKGNKPCSAYSNGCRLCMNRGGDNCGWKVNYLDGSQSCVENDECDSVDNVATFCTKASDVKGYPGEGKRPQGNLEDRKATCRCLNEVRKKGPPPSTCQDLSGDCNACLSEGCTYDGLYGCHDSVDACPGGDSYYDGSGYQSDPSKIEGLCLALDKPQPPTDDQGDSLVCTNLDGACSVCVDRGCVYDYYNDACFDAGTECDGCLELSINTPNFLEIVTDYCLNGPTIVIDAPEDDGYDRPDGYDGDLILFDEGRKAPPPKPDLVTDDQSFTCEELSTVCEICLDRGCKYDYDTGDCFDINSDECPGCYAADVANGYTTEVFYEIAGFCQTGRKPDRYTDPQDFSCEELAGACDVCLDRGCAYDGESCYDECPAGAACVTASDTEAAFATCADLIGVRR